MSAAGLTAVATDALLFDEFGSISLPLTLAKFVIEPAKVGLTVIVIVALPPLTSVPIEHVTVDVPLHVPEVEDAETYVTPPGNESVIVTPVAGSGPLFVTTIV